MDEIIDYKFKRNESFYIREGWFEKAVHLIADPENSNIFSKNYGIKILGIGSNMVKGLRYWLVASGLVTVISSKTSLTELGRLIYEYDRYFESPFTWSIIHSNLVRNQVDCPLFSVIFNSNIKSFTKEDAIENVYESLLKNNPDVTKKYIFDDMPVFLKTYVNEGTIENPEENYVCPISSLKLLEKKGGKYVKSRPSYQSISYLTIYWLLSSEYGKEKSFNIEDCISRKNSPSMIFNLDKSAFLQYLEEMKRDGLISVNKTAGLNTVYFDKTRLSIGEIFDRYFGGR
ncbi:MAG: DUF4007 family protein [Bacilli bacterium]|nr:DUF4007 family protein [Bacilli bacterium]